MYVPTNVWDGNSLRHRQVDHGKLKMAWASWDPHIARPGGPRDVYNKFGEARPYRCNDMT